MTDIGPLAGLDDIDWAGLSHAYGPAADVPESIRGLASADTERREKASWTLYGNIFHQGSRYEATPHAVPFLLAMAADPDMPDRPGIVRMLGALAIGYDESYLPSGVNAEQWRGKVAKMNAADPAEVYREYDEWVAQASDDVERRSREFRRGTFDFDSARAGASWELAAYDAVRAGVPVLSGLLDDADAELRGAAAWAVSWFPEESAVALPRLLSLLETEEDPGVLANAIVAVGLLGSGSVADRLRAFLTGAEPLPRWAAATALARLGVADTEVISELTACSAEPPEQGEPGVEYHEGDLRGYSSESLAWLDGEVPGGAVTAVLDGLSRASGLSLFTVTAAALRLTFGDEPLRPRPRFAELTEPQQRCVRVLASVGDDAWQWVNFTEILRAWNLPDKREDLQRYAVNSVDG